MDRRQRRTRNAIFEAFSVLLENKSYSSMTVQDIIDRADIGRSTFYAHFETKDELLKALCNDIFDHVFSAEIMSEEKHDFSNHSSFRDRITHILYHLQEKQQSIRGLFNGECGEIFLRYLKEYLYQVFNEHITIKDDVPHDYALDLAVSSFAETVRWWLKGHSDYTPEQMTAYFFRCISIL
ncbi:TetR/AcrR family transcriptional regulator [Ruminococcus sp.]|uniref:TetR/AcrR family transcriptional regulator n=1 Tax=Ruminococcus sp. TaxID=41978 RepID=UPI0025FCF966|nr:TetR/AcrR family transcriptional regulator [Ruminococcus sp.]